MGIPKYYLQILLGTYLPKSNKKKANRYKVGVFGKNILCLKTDVLGNLKKVGR